MFAIEVENLSHNYDKIKALDNISFKVKKGEKVAILGPNGSGKTTLMLCISGLIKPAKGRIKVMDVEVNKKNEEKVRRVVGIVFQNPDDQVFSATVFDDIAFGLRNMGIDEGEVIKKVKEVMRILRISHLATRNPANLSGGEKKKVAIAGIIVMNPKVLLIDEPTAGLDHSGVHEIFNVLCELNAMDHTIIVTTHDSEFAFAWADRIVVMNNGKIVKSIDNSIDNSEIHFDKIRELELDNTGVRIRLPGKVKFKEELESLGVISDIFEALKENGKNKGKVKIIEYNANENEYEHVDYCYGLVDFSLVKAVEYDIELIMLESFRREVKVMVSQRLKNKFIKFAEKFGVSVCKK